MMLSLHEGWKSGLEPILLPSVQNAFTPNLAVSFFDELVDPENGNTTAMNELRYNFPQTKIPIQANSDAH